MQAKRYYNGNTYIYIIDYHFILREVKKIIVKLYVHFVSVCLKVKKWTQNPTWVTFYHPRQDFYFSAMV